MVPLVTVPSLCIVRYHGRNARLWYARVQRAADRFDYLYTRAELEEWVPRLRALAAQVASLHVLFNNNAHDYAVQNALQLRGLLVDELGAQVVLPASQGDAV